MSHIQSSELIKLSFFQPPTIEISAMVNILYHIFIKYTFIAQSKIYMYIKLMFYKLIHLLNLLKSKFCNKFLTFAKTYVLPLSSSA